MGERIVASAIRYNGLVCALPIPARHHHLIHAIAGVTGKPVGGSAEQGFVTDEGRFVDRAEAKAIAVASEQTDTVHKHLFSEDVW
jgi:hypothetical protein